MKKFIADVRVRKQDRNGNTYHDVTIFDMDGKQIAEIVKEYGYGQQYKQTTADMLNNYINDCKYFYINVEEDVIFIDHHY